jgi:hypothetical protein
MRPRGFEPPRTKWSTLGRALFEWTWRWSSWSPGPWRDWVWRDSRIGAKSGGRGGWLRVGLPRTLREPHLQRLELVDLDPRGDPPTVTVVGRVSRADTWKSASSSPIPRREHTPPGLSREARSTHIRASGSAATLQVPTRTKGSGQPTEAPLRSSSSLPRPMVRDPSAGENLQSPCVPVLSCR